MATTIDQEQELKQEALTVTQKAALVKITDQPSYDSASALLLEQIIPFRKRWAEYWNPLKKAAYDSWKAITAKFEEGDAPAAQAERVVKAAIVAWDMEQERIRQEAQRKAQEEAERLAKEEQLKAAIAAEQAGASKEQVDDIFSAPVAVVAAPVAPTYQRAAGISKMRENWSAEVTDIAKLVKAVAAGKVSYEYILPNQVALNARAKADKSTMNIPGVIARNIPVIAGRVK
jgi:hypothetical protein